jgi:hypothetical protein
VEERKSPGDQLDKRKASGDELSGERQQLRNLVHITHVHSNRGNYDRHVNKT